MRAIIVFSSKTGRTKKVAEAIASGLSEKNLEIEFAHLDAGAKKSGQKLSAQEFVAAHTDVSAFDLVIIGSPVFGLSPKRKISRAVESYLRQCKGIGGKKTAVFLTCFGIPGTSLKKITGIIQARGADVCDSIVVAYLLGISEKQLEQAKEFGKKISGTN